MKNIEIEIRIKLKKPVLFLRWLKKTAKKIKTCDQTDFYFDPPCRSFIYKDTDGSRNADEWLRIRTMSKGDEICYKYWHKDPKTGKSTYADEIETSIGNAKQGLKILKRLGFKQISVIKKHREDWKYKNFVFSCDKTEGLGFFVEIEYHGKINDPAKGRQKILDLLKSIGVKDWKKIKGGYPWMQWNPDKNHFED
ncbi:MAG: class IV adenylate cyclase [bacterium]